MEKIRHSLRAYLLQRLLKTAKRRRRVVEYASASQVGLLFDYATDESIRASDALARQLQADGKSVSALGFVNAGTVPEDASPAGFVRLCCRKDFSWLLKPRRDFLREFTGREFDLLIDLSSSRSHAMKFLAARSVAIFKTGASHPDYNDVYDLIMQVGEDCPADELARHITHYLKIIKTRNKDA